MAPLKQEPRSYARGFAQFFRQPELWLLLAAASFVVSIWSLGRRLDQALAGSLCGFGYHEELGCVADALLVADRVWIPEFAMEVPAADFEAAGRSGSAPGTPMHTAHAAGFWADRLEAHEPALASGQRSRRLSLERANAYCLAQGGRLPTSEEWVLLAAYPRRARYPWGDTGLLCRSASWGRVAGPCAWHLGEGAPASDAALAAAADAPGAHPEGCSPVGVCDMVGNRAEWSTDGKLHGGSYASTFAGELRVWSIETPAPGTTPEHAGARCVYDATP